MFIVSDLLLKNSTIFIFLFFFRFRLELIVEGPVRRLVGGLLGGGSGDSFLMQPIVSEGGGGGLLAQPGDFGGGCEGRLPVWWLLKEALLNDGVLPMQPTVLLLVQGAGDMGEGGAGCGAGDRQPLVIEGGGGGRQPISVKWLVSAGFKQDS